MDFATSLQYVKGIGPVRAAMLAAKNLSTVEDLLYYVPFRYEDRRNRRSISELAPGEKAVVIARLASSRTSRFRGRLHGLFEARLEDGSGSMLEARWFYGERYAESLTPGRMVALFGKVELNPATRGRMMVQPEIELLAEAGGNAEFREESHLSGIVPVYEAAGKLTTRTFRKLLPHILDELQWPGDPLPESLRRERQLPCLRCAIQEAHLPAENADVELLNEFRSPAQHRLIFEEFFWLECGLTLKKRKTRERSGVAFSIDERVRQQIKRMLPFKPTGEQRRVMQEIAEDMKQPNPMNRLLQGDVGSGKTMVALQAALIALENGYQVAVLAPTEILAQQHFTTFRNQLQPLGYSVGALSGSLNAREKQQLKALLKGGHLQLVVGTHALLQEDVLFEKLGLAIVDEQHRFGVRQRWEMFQKGSGGVPPDVLVMTATPIPRTLALTVYGDLDVSTIGELPPGRRAIITRHITEPQIEQAYRFVASQVEAGRQAYFVYPTVEEGETQELRAAERMFRHLSEVVFPSVSVGLLHGRMAPDEKEGIMTAFKAGEVQILVSTTVVEVGVDVSNASVMVIEQAERFGLAQLHQLRGRVGRGAAQSYCLLATGAMNDVARERVRTMVESNDGFYIAEMDMKLRGPGELSGTRQSGIPGLRLADISRDSDILAEARDAAQSLLGRTSDPDGEVRRAIEYLKENWQRRYGLVAIG